MARTSPGDPVAVVEAGYTWSPSDVAWVDAVVGSCHRYDAGAGVVGCLVRVGTTTEVTVVRGSAEEHVAEQLRSAIEALPPPLARHALRPTEFVGNAAYRLSRIARTASPGIATSAAATMRDVPPMWALICGDVRARALILCFPRRDRGSAEDPFPHADSRALGLAGAHLGAALRLRDLAFAAGNDANTEAVLSTTGKVLHATGAAAAMSSRASLAEAVLASETARRHARSTTRDEALREWTALVDGRWTIVEMVERDGKRLILARRNRMRSTDLLGLSDDERDVCWLAALGHSYKYIAYELGVPLTTAAGRLSRAMRKLRLRSRAELVRHLGVPR